MNRRSFLKSIAALPFVAGALAGARPNNPTPDDIKRKWDALAPDDTVADLVQSDRLRAGMAVCLHDGVLIPAQGESPIVGIAARDIEPGETVEYIPYHNTEDIITYGKVRGVCGYW